MAEFYTGKKAFTEKEDFQEEDVWGMMKEKEGSSSLKLKTSKNSPSPSPSACRIPALPRVIPRVHNPHASAPLNIPDWSKIYGGKKSSHTNNSRDDHHHHHYHHDFAKCEYDDDVEDETLPPHEFIARRAARSPVVSFSMCEGIGRTLKGRDLSNLRNAILTRTGFIE